MKPAQHFPLLDISEFHHEQSSGNDLLYHDIIGERHIEKPHKHDFYLFMLFEHGSGVHNIDFVDHAVGPGQLHLLFPEQIHKWDLKPQTRAYQVMMSKHFFDTIANSLRFSLVLYQNHPVIELEKETFKKILNEFELIKAELSRTDMIWEILKSRINLIALLTSREAEKVFDNNGFYSFKPVLLKYLSLINVHYAEEKLVTFYAKKLNISANYLNILCKKHFKVAATALIHERLILEIKRMLHSSAMPIKEIAFELGFYDVAYFSKFFKSHMKMTPSAFREQS